MKNPYKSLYEKIPTFECKPGCSDCCGIVPIAKQEAKKLRIKGHSILPLQPGTTHCQYATDKGCSVYKNRPFLCRLFGTVEKMPCPHGCGPEKLLTQEQEKQLTEAYFQQMEQ